VALGAVEPVDEMELAFVVLLVGVDVLPTAVTDGVLVVVVRVGVVVVVVAGVEGRVDALVVALGEGVGVVVGPATGVAVVVVAVRLVVNLRSTQYWLACRLSLGKALLVPYV
jgi:hypothetical protein